VLSRESLQREYWDLGKSPARIAAEAGTYANAVRRELLRHWPRLRNRAEAQANALARGHQRHPTAGRGHTPEGRANIGRATSGTPGPNRSKAARRRWVRTPVLQRRRFVRRGRAAAGRSARAGSRAELFLLEGLRAAGLAPEHRRGHGDLLLPHRGVAVFVDGRPLLEPVWGEDALARAREAAAAKRRAAVAAGLSAVRVLVRPARPSRAHLQTLLTALLMTLELAAADSNPGEYEVG
jgi:hypothetical protein